uniref:Bcl-2-like protein 12 n=1 Tax=Leptobrachium leishanense TaxID=445787 RepID=A0A8C5PEB7_9ANUR
MRSKLSRSPDKVYITAPLFVLVSPCESSGGDRTRGERTPSASTSPGTVAWTPSPETHPMPAARSRSYVDDKEGSLKKNKSEKKKSKDSIKENDEPRHDVASGAEHNGTWNSLHEKINSVEEKKHGFQTGFKKLLRRPSQPKDKQSGKTKSGSVHSKSRDSLENVLAQPKKENQRSDSLKRQKLPNPLIACAAAGSVDESEETDGAEATDKPSSQPKSGRGFQFKNILKKKPSKTAKASTESRPVRPDSLPLVSPYGTDAPHHPDEAEIYDLAARKLDNLVRHQKLKSPVATVDILKAKESLKPTTPENNNVAEVESSSVEGKEELIHKLVALLQEQAVIINEKINKEPFLRNALSRMSYSSFSRLAELFTSQAEVEDSDVGAGVSPELTKIALTMELTRKVAGINSHAVHTLMGYSMQYMDMFVPWLQQQGGWEGIVFQVDGTDNQID